MGFFRDIILAFTKELEMSKLNFPLLPYQEEGVKFILANRRNNLYGRGLICDERGLGKTVQAIACLNQLNCPKTIIICPAGIKIQWATELTKWLSKSPKIQIIHSGDKKIYKRNKIFIINYDILDKYKKELSKISADFIIADEVHKIKNNDSKRFKAFKKIAFNAPYILGLTGTPIDGRPIDMYNILNLIDPKRIKSKIEYSKYYCNAQMRNWGWDDKGISHKKEFKQLLSNYAIARTKAQVLPQLPQKRRVLLNTPLTNEERYLKIKEDVDRKTKWIEKTIRELKYSDKEEKDKLIEEKRSILLNLKQKERMACFTEKKDYIIDWISAYLEADETSKLIVFTIHKKTAAIINNKFKKESVVITGSTPDKQKEEFKRQFINNKKTRLLIGNIQTIGTGIDGLQEVCDTSLTVEIPYTAYDLDQAEDRMHRIGQKNPVTCYYVIGDNSIDEFLLTLVNKKKKESENLIYNNRRPQLLEKNV